MGGRLRPPIANTIMLTLSLIGIGCGDPAHLTRKAVDAINAADLILIPRKGEEKSDLADLRRQICADVLSNAGTQVVEFDLPVRDSARGDYRAGVDDWHDAIAARWSREIESHLGNDGRVAPAPQIEVVPGITAIQALCAAHALPLNEIGEPFLVTTGRRLREGGWP